jgi:hypothetical protein
VTTSTASAPAISRFPVPQLDDLPDDIRQRILAVQEKSGFIPNVFLRWRTARTSSAPSLPTTMR